MNKLIFYAFATLAMVILAPLYMLGLILGIVCYPLRSLIDGFKHGYKGTDDNVKAIGRKLVKKARKKPLD